MPKVVDHEKQREAVAEATWRVIGRAGLEGATFRTIAGEAGISVGALQHYFPTQDSLFIFCMELINRRSAERIAALEYPHELPFLDHLRNILDELLPIDEERVVAAKVWLAFSTKALYSPELAQLSRQMNDNMRTVYELTLGLLSKFDIAKPDMDFTAEVDRLFALIDGLSLRALIAPHEMSVDRMRTLVYRHLVDLCDPIKLKERSP
jgi:AcrR family transcriptional regulator